MKKIYLIILFCFVFLKAFLQQDPEAKKILDQSSQKIKSFKSIQVSFKLTVEDRKEKTSSSSEGVIKIKGDKYWLQSSDDIVYFNGKTMWTVGLDIKEVTITEPNMEDSDFLSNPAKIFTWYDRDFKFRYDKQTTLNGIDVYEIDLFPKNLEQPYSRIKVFISVKDLLLQSLKSVGKDGIDYSVKLSDYITNKEFDDSIFTFDPSKYKKFEIVDMRL